ncbi:MAG: phosphoribosylanthranilate isomerase [Desulfovibrio sp.]|jgi:phosphoribosylanthranilate isomerase|nr:phosphoribosylanthranilate isomerase [Desulfovibrio sp.]
MPERLCKICGLSRSEDVLLCHSLGVDFTGFIFTGESKRFISPEAAGALPSGPALRVGVFVNATADYILGCVKIARLDFIQLHGGESPEFCKKLGAERIIKTLWPRRYATDGLQAEMEGYAGACAYFLLDAGQGGGGSGASLNFKDLAKIHPPRPWFLAGGLGPENLPVALHTCSPDGLDCNSALESAPGVKDHALLRRAVAVIHQHNKEKL